MRNPIAASLLLLPGCVGGQRTAIATSQPVEADALSGMVAAKVTASMSAELSAIRTSVGAVRGDLSGIKSEVGFTSQFGPGATIVVCLAVSLIAAALLLTLRLLFRERSQSHEREELRIKTRAAVAMGKQETEASA